ncbi:hypothetical protein BpHYR1_046413 [Brachionus plicatilis]|uniref:Uncharacterized protein n=1 Tax=Brachionus plicatilis TaxID=10195 RepID=A0A3M7RI56_BRAPC|nr:hypothetical protein BpHYR1_046413 [Brachionus plicatilis]
MCNKLDKITRLFLDGECKFPALAVLLKFLICTSIESLYFSWQTDDSASSLNAFSLVSFSRGNERLLSSARVLKSK